MTDVIDREAESNSARVGVSDASLQELVDQARADGLQLTGEGGLLATIRNVSTGWDNGLKALVTEHGVTVDDAPTHPPAPTYPPTPPTGTHERDSPARAHPHTGTGAAAAAIGPSAIRNCPRSPETDLSPKS
ncbi:hypothetical protein [Rhodococcus sp. NPDC057529]|uniref:hypothetical protein n=1 Tax=Rhodococcus sp. NPDC057529 TaxID=3346158 RepID=UPI00366DAC51